jgi:hypothetical protein
MLLRIAFLKMRYYAVNMIKFVGEDLKLSWNRYRLRRLINKLKPISTLNSHYPDIEIMSMVSHRDLWLYLTAIKSFIFYAKEAYPITVEDDGTLTKNDIKKLQSFIKGLRVVSNEEAEEKANKKLVHHPLIKSLRQTHRPLRKDIDLPLNSVKHKIVMMDSDLIYQKEPVEIKHFIASTKHNQVMFMNDLVNNLSVSETEAKYYFHTGLIANLNSGLIGFNPNDVNLKLMDKLFKFLKQNNPRIIKAQTSYALMFADKKYRKVRLPDKYLIQRKKYQNRLNTICGHFTSHPGVRELFYPKAYQVLKAIIKAESEKR